MTEALGMGEGMLPIPSPALRGVAVAPGASAWSQLLLVGVRWSFHSPLGQRQTPQPGICYAEPLLAPKLGFCSAQLQPVAPCWEQTPPSCSSWVPAASPNRSGSPGLWHTSPSSAVLSLFISHLCHTPVPRAGHLLRRDRSGAGEDAGGEMLLLSQNNAPFFNLFFFFLLQCSSPALRPACVHYNPSPAL